MKKVLIVMFLSAVTISFAACDYPTQSIHSIRASVSKKDSSKIALIADTPQKFYVTNYKHVKQVVDGVETDNDSFTISFVLKDGTKQDILLQAYDAWKKDGNGDLTDSPYKTASLKKTYDDLKKAKATDFYLEFKDKKLLNVGLLSKVTESKDGTAGIYIPAVQLWNGGYLAYQNY